MKKVKVIVRTTEDNFPPQEKVVLKFTEQTVSSAENDTVLSYPGLEIHLEHAQRGILSSPLDHHTPHRH